MIGWMMVGLANKLMDKDKSAQFDACHAGAGYRLQSGERITEALRRELQAQGYTVRVAERSPAARDNAGRLDSSYRPVIDVFAALIDPLERDEPRLENSYRYGANAGAGNQVEIPAGGW